MAKSAAVVEDSISHESEDQDQDHGLVCSVEIDGVMRKVYSDDRIAYSEDNPKREGTKIHALYEKYKKASTIGELEQLFGKGWKAAIKYDAPRGILKFLDDPQES